MHDDIRSLSDELARDPTSLVFLRLGELLRCQRHLDAAERVARLGAERHPGLAAAHDLLARIAADRGDDIAAAAAWQNVLRLVPSDAGAHKGLGFLAYRAGRYREAAGHLAQAASADPGDPGIASALEMVRARLGASASGTSLFADLAGELDVLLLVDRDGLVLGGTACRGGEERTAAIGAHLAGVSDEARRAMRHLDLGAWSAIMVETEDASVALAPVSDDVIVLAAAPRATPMGLVRRVLGRAVERAAAWLGAGEAAGA